MRLYIVRHGQTDWNVRGLAGGHRDEPLDETGKMQARRLGLRFRHTPLDRIVSSDLRRSLQTAQAVAEHHSLPVEADPRLRERDMGVFEGKPHEEMVAELERIAQQTGVTPFEARPPGGESFQDVWERIGPVAEDLKRSSGDTLVVTHGGTATVLVARLLGLQPVMARAFRFANTGVSEIVPRSDGSLVLVRHNDVSHLDPDSPVLSGDVEGVHS
ncbi:MAG: histidine phosphatase family protein [Fimbriimonadales bacterium]|nr:histidine phosphatase family protein [Fimbriimonadales bacterium]